MSFPTVNPGQAIALSNSFLQDPGGIATNAQAMFTFGGFYLDHYLAGGANHIWSNSSCTYNSDLNTILSICNGGDSDSGDNAVYEMPLTSTQLWGRVVNPTFASPSNRLIPAFDEVGPGPPTVYIDTTNQYGAGLNAPWPCSRHTYMGNVYMRSQQKFWLAGGSRWYRGGPVSDIWWYDPVAHSFALQAESFSDGLGISAAWDPHLQRIYFHGQAFLRYYDPALTAGSRIVTITGDEGQWTSARMSALFDWRRRRYVMLGWNSAFGGTSLFYYDLLRTPNSGTRVIQDLSAGGFPGVDITVEFPGFLYDIIRDRYIVSFGATTFSSSPLSYGGTANILWEINPDTFASNPITYTGTTVALRTVNTPNCNLIHDVVDDVYIYLSSVQQNQYAFRNPDQTNVFTMANRTL